jgi:hypothetical protein
MEEKCIDFGVVAVYSDKVSHALIPVKLAQVVVNRESDGKGDV